MRYGWVLVFLCLRLWSFGQKTILIQGYIKDEENQPVAYAEVFENISQKSYLSDENGRFSLKALTNQNLEMEIHFLGFKRTLIHFEKDRPGTYEITIHLVRDIKILGQVNIKPQNSREDNFYYLNPEISSVLPNASGNFETYLKTFPGVSSNNELSSQYSVRGGNYDENLVYVNEIEIFRPFLVQQGQQEGLSFVNPEMVAKIKFSTGGFGPEYGDKMSSVLDILYKKPNQQRIQASISLLGASLNLEYKNPKNGIGILLGLRERSNQFLLNTLDIHGNYRPLFSDFQSLVQIPLNPRLNLETMIYGAYNIYKISPTDRQTTFGTLSQVYQLNVSMQGEELDKSLSGLVGLKLDYAVHKNTFLKWMASYYGSGESQSKSIQGDYLFENVQTGTLGGGQNIVQGIGEYGEDAGNKLRFSNLSLEHKGNTLMNKSLIKWGIKYDHENIRLKLDQIAYLDTLPLNYQTIPNYKIKVQALDSFNQFNQFGVNRLSFFGVEAFDLGKRIHFDGGIRFTYLDYNHEFLWSPRLMIAYRPPINEDLVFRFAYGIYYQSPLFNEYFNYDGTLSPKRPSQRSIQYNLFSDWKFPGLGTELNLLTGLYYKDLQNLIPYEINDVKIDYLGKLNSKGFAYGLDIRLGGQLVTNLESSISLSYQRTEEKIDHYYYPQDSAHLTNPPQEVGYIPRPTDQRINLALFFQDKLVGDPSSKVHLNLIYGSNLPIGPPDHIRYQDVFRAPAYRRVDIGFSKEFIGSILTDTRKFYGIKSLVVYAEVFNLLNINNTISYFWIRDIQGNRFAVPNYLTSRVFNLKIQARF